MWRFTFVLEDALILIGGLILVYLGGRWLVGGASQLAASLGVRPFVIGLTIVGFGTSAPELALGVLANAEGSGAVSLGNVIGSNIANVTYVLAASAIIVPLVLKFDVLRKEAMVAMGGVVLLLVFALTGALAWWAGAIMIGAFLAYLVYFILTLERCDPASDITCQFEDVAGKRWGKGRSLGLIALGLLLLITGAQATVTGATDIARGLGVSEVLIGITIISFGTVLPELTVAVMSALRKRPDLALGNTMGTITFNTLVVLGAGALVSGGIEVTSTTLITGILPMIGFMALALGMIYYKGSIGRRTGLAMMALYVAYIAALVALEGLW